MCLIVSHGKNVCTRTIYICCCLCQKVDWHLHKRDCQPSSESHIAQFLAGPDAHVAAVAGDSGIDSVDGGEIDVHVNPALICAEDACSVCGVRGVKLRLCAQCRLKKYCSAVCQARLPVFLYSVY